MVDKDYCFYPPEILDNYSNDKINYASDIFSIGCLLYTLKYEKYPFESRFASINYNYPHHDD